MSPGSTRPSVGILDTSAFIQAPRLQDPGLLPEDTLITAVTLAELSVGPLTTHDPLEQANRQSRLQEAEAGFDPLPFDQGAARAFGAVASSLRRAGRKTSARTFDSLIAAIAISNDLPLYTCNPRDFAGIEGLKVVPVPTS